MENLVLFKGHVGGITVILNKDAPFKKIVEQFEDKLIGAKKFFEGTCINVHFKGRMLTEQEEEVLLGLLANQNILNISYVQVTSQTENRISNLKEAVDQQKKIQKENKEDKEDKEDNQLGEWDSVTHYYHGTVRSGQQIQYSGSVVILGDVNPGGVVSAGNRVIVIGALKGIVKAGQSSKANKPFVIAYQMAPSQITIGSLTAQPPENEAAETSKKRAPQVAYTLKEKIYVEEIDYKTLQHMLE